MYKLDVGLGFSIIRDAYDNWDTGILYDVIGQHRIILSEEIINYYCSQMEPDCIWKQAFLDKFIFLNKDDTKVADPDIEEPDGDIMEEIISCVRRTPMRILISDNNEFSDYNLDNINITTKEDIKSKTKDCLFNWYVIPVDLKLHDGEPCNRYIDWLGHLFENEATIIIVDPYLLSDYNLDSFIKTILPKIPRETNIEIYCAKDKTTADRGSRDYYETAISIINNLNKTQNRRIKVNWCKYKLNDKRNMHDRFIILSDCEIEITGGWSVLNAGKLINSESKISVTREIMHSLPQVCEVSGLGIQGVQKIESQSLPNKSVPVKNELISLIGSEVTLRITEIIPKGGANGMINGKYKASVPSKWLKDSNIQTGQEVLAIVISVNENKCIVKPV